MPESQEPRNNIWNGWDTGQSGTGAQKDENWLRLATFAGLSVVDRDLTAPPGSATDGDIYIPAAPATGVWVGREDQLAVWRQSDSSWEFYNPSLTRARLLAYIEDENRLVVWNGTNWTNGVNFSV